MGVRELLDFEVVESLGPWGFEARKPENPKPRASPAAFFGARQGVPKLRGFAS